ncbi:MAG: tetratricopeptide repeat protein [Burkholderiaceae bacterium]|nr:tetratricopeptide repeat protein [Burkholderiaceae bacterium]
MMKHRPLVLALGACLLQACTTPPAKQEMATQVAIHPVLQIRHSSDQTAASYYQLGKYHLERGNLDLARTAYNFSITLDSRQLEVRNALAALYAQQGKLDEAKALLLQIVADYPEVAHPYNNLGYVYYLQNNYDAAVTHLQRALVLDSGNERARNNLDAVQMALANRGERTTMTPVLTRQAAAQPPPPPSEPVTSSVADTRSQGLMIMSPPLEPQARMEVVQIVPNVYELRLKNAIDSVLAELQTEKAPVRVAPSTPAGVIAIATSTATKMSRVEVANGNGVAGMAKRISKVLGQHGIAVSRLTNERPYKQQDTKIQYRLGYEQTAEGLKQALQGQAVVVLSQHLPGNSDVRLVLGRDAIAQMALIEGSASTSLMALNSVSN